MGFAHLHVHTEYSLLDGLAGVKELTGTAAEMGMKSLAITDHGNMFGVIDFYNAAKEKGIRPVIGCEVYTAARSMDDRDSALDRDQGHLILLAENNTGYKNLVKLVSAGNLRGFYYKPRVDKEILAKHAEGLIALSACIGGDVPQKLLKNKGRPEYDEAENYEAAKREALLFQEIFGKGNFYLEIQNQGLEEEDFILPFMKKISGETGIPLVATNDIHYLKREHAEAHDVLLCIQTGKRLADEARMRFTGDQFYFRSEAEMRALFPDLPDAIDITEEIAARCNVEFDFESKHLPEFTAPDGWTNTEYLRHLCAEGLKERYRDAEEQYRPRLEHELAIIEKMGFVEYFLIVWDFIKYARDNGIPVGPGRGSAAGSIVSYALHITDIDPIKYNLIFERFLNPERVSMPDIDIDFCDERRGEVIDYVVAKYGEDKVAQIITFGTLKAKAVIRDVGRVVDMPLDKVDRIAKLVPDALGIGLADAIEKEPKLKEMIRTDQEVARLFNYAKILEGKSRHAGTHAAGVVITKKALDEYVPLFNSKNGISTQFTMTTIERLGLLKMDFLGLRNLSVIDDAVKMIETGHGVKIDFSAMEMDDPEAYRLIAAGNTDGVFQLENPGMRDFVKKMAPTNFEDIIVGISLYRPGPMEKIPDYLRNRSHPERIKYDDPLLEPILGVTYGVMVYQEQVMQIVRDLAGYDYGRSDDVRRAMSKKKHDEMQKNRAYFVHGLHGPAAKGRDVPGCEGNGIDERVANKIFDDMIDFASYAFNKSHAAAYAVVAYRTAYLKAHYPTEFMAALMSSFMGGDGSKIAQYIRNCKELGVEVLPPCILKSDRKFSVEDGKIRMGLRSVKSCGDNAIDAIVRLRESGARLESVRDFVDHIDASTVNAKAAENLIYAGAFDCIQPNRASALRMHKLFSEQAKKERGKVMDGQGSLFEIIRDEISQSDEDLIGSDFDIPQKLALEKEVLGMYFSGHPLDGYKWIVDEIVNTTSDELNHPEDCVERKTSGDVIMIGQISNAKHIITKKGDRMAVILLEDLFGAVEIVVFPKAFERSGDTIRENEIVVVRGKAERDSDDTARIFASKVTPIETVEDFFLNRKCVEAS
ncbi:MAG: DNA polymerase III subunit alpha [Clostridiales Family XIII bacterium]|jgi:DNA polymerase-3 subunit alpha|nr:DNA polymerase III subunit alpha [Clostridiales Family XIII bacterium]